MVLGALIISVMTYVLTAMPRSYARSAGDESAEFTEKEPADDEQGWLVPVSRRGLQIFNVFFFVVLLVLTGTSLYLRRRLKEKIKGLENTQQQLKDQNEVLRLVTENTTEGIWDFHVDTGEGTLSRQWYPMFGYEPVEKDVPLSEWRKYVHSDDLAASEEAFLNFIEAGAQNQFESEMRLRRADGTWCWVLSRGRTVAWDDSGKPLRIIGLHLDIQKSKDNHEKIEQSKENFRKLFKYSPIPLALSSEQGKIIDVNHRMTEVLGYTLDDMESNDRRWFLANPDPSCGQEVEATWQAAVDAAMASGSSVEPREYCVTCKDGTERIMIIEATIINRNLLVSFFDMTDHRRAEEERKKLREQLLQAQKLEAVGVLAGGVAHDFNNMIGAIMGYSELILGRMEAENPHRCDLEKILEAAHRSADLTRQLLAFARKQTVAPVILDLNLAVESMLKLLRRLIGENIDLAWLPGKASCRVMIDPSQLDQILANLCVNARDAIDDVGTITIETKYATFDQTYCDMHPGFKPNADHLSENPSNFH